MARTKQTARRSYGGPAPQRRNQPMRSLPREIPQQKDLRELHGDEDDVFARKRKRPSESESEEGGTVARLPTEIWTMIAAKVRDTDMMAFALTSKKHREAQQQAGRKLVTRPYYQRANGDHICEYFSRDWCAWWSRHFNMTETAPQCMNRVIMIAAAEGYLDVLKTYWSDIPEDKKPLLMDERTCAWAASGGHLKTLQWLRSQGCPWDSYTCGWAAESGHLKCLQWARSEGCSWSQFICRVAAQDGQLECLQWARENGCPWYATTMCDEAASHGHLPVLKWVREQGCPWGEAATLNAARNGHIKCFRWLLYQGCPCNHSECRTSGKANIQQWMREQENL